MTQPTDPPPRLTIRDPAVMRALAHPARLSIMERLGVGEPATATECAELVGLSPSATSYHLRALARVGLVEQAPSRGDGRERLWRTLVRGMQIEPDAAGDQEAQAAERELIESFLIRDEARVRAWVARMYTEPADWMAASVFSEALVALTAAELAELTGQLTALIDRYRPANRPVPPAGARRVSLMVRAFPTEPAS